MVPTHLETKHRGFYINSGELDFETVPDISSEEETASSESDVRKRRPVCSHLIFMQIIFIHITFLYLPICNTSFCEQMPYLHIYDKLAWL